MKVTDILIKMPFNIERSTNLALIIKGMKETGLDTLPVVDKDMRLVGIITLGDIAKIFEPYSGPIQTLVKSLPFLDRYVLKIVQFYNIYKLHLYYFYYIFKQYM